MDNPDRSSMAPDEPEVGDEDAIRSDDAVDEPSYSQRMALLLLRLGAVLAVVVLVLVLMTAGAAQYTSRSAFCNSCHIMEPYYVSWQESSHHDVACIKCHFPPGAGEKVRGKMQGLVQLLKYVTQTAGPRLSAEIPDESCLRCHDTRLLSGRVEFQGVPFDHGPHLADTRRGKKLRCTSCHGQIVQGDHMTVTASTCFLCHFKNTALNEGLGTCTRCHEIPEETFDIGGGVSFTHDLAYERGVDCASCHSDLVRGKGEVPLERCSVCHNRPDDLQRIDDHEFLHQTHVTDHKVDCLDCHLEIQHTSDPHKVERSAADCQSCHPNEHASQIHLLRGMGGKSISSQHGGMAMVGMTCQSCHQHKATSESGDELWRASYEVCMQCHDAAANERLLARHEQLNESLSALEADLARVHEAISAANFEEPRSAEITQQIRDLEDDLQFLRVGNSIHNLHYADSLSRVLMDNVRNLCRELDIPEPAIELPANSGPPE
jgi:predicted CXXCH cytochrome family protein